MTLHDCELLHAEYIDEYKIKLHFHDGKSGQIDFAKYFGTNKIYDEIKNVNIFRSFTIESGILCWQNKEIDIAPETLYCDSTGTPYPDWLED